GDERLYPLSPVVMEAWNNADRIVGEISTNDWAVFQTEMQNRMIQSQIKNGGKNFLPKLNEKQKNVLYSILQKEGAEGLATFEPWVTTTAINTEVYLRSGLSVEKGMDGLFMISAYQQNKKMEGLDSLDTQFELLQFGTYDEQLTMLKDTLDALDENKTVTEYTKKMYEAYLANDLRTLSSLIQQGRIDDSKRNALYKNYYAQMFTERNKNWADKIEQYLKEGGMTFIFAGTGHFVGSDSVFAYLKSKGIAPLE
ncbi:MAG: TraB/GumN family protein, partial [Treponema sp.]|nr:TraB/GumN family protein [Treponema sp.]